MSSTSAENTSLVHAFVGPFRFTWMSICSKHRGGGPESTCGLCRAGYWSNDFGHALSSWLYAADPDLWRYYANLPDSPTDVEREPRAGSQRQEHIPRRRTKP